MGKSLMCPICGDNLWTFTSPRYGSVTFDYCYSCLDQLEWSDDQNVKPEAGKIYDRGGIFYFLELHTEL